MTGFGTGGRALMLVALVTLAGCEDGFDLDLRGAAGSDFSTAQAAQSAAARRPAPDDRGVISYPSYQVAVAQRGDTVTDVAARVGTDAQALARFNGLARDVPLRAGEVIALPSRVAEPSPATGAPGTGPIQPPQVDVTALAGRAIETASPTPPTQSGAQPQVGEEPIRHQVRRGETAYSIARLYAVSVRDLARWNGLGPQFEVREGQYLLIPVAEAGRETARAEATPPPGAGSPTPTPPSAERPLPQESAAPAAPPPPAPDLGARTQPTPSGRFALPVQQGTIIRDYAKGRNEGISIKGTPGATVTAADAGTVAAITESAEGVPILVLRHEGNLLTVYANVTDLLVKRGDSVRRGQGLAKLRGGDQSFVHFEVREGFDSVDPNAYLN